jgi:hypothetical protein
MSSAQIFQQNFDRADKPADKITCLFDYHASINTFTSEDRAFRWPWSFLDSIHHQLMKGSELSPKQLAALEKVFTDFAPLAFEEKATKQLVWNERLKADSAITRDIDIVFDSINAQQMISQFSFTDRSPEHTYSLNRHAVLNSGFWGNRRSDWDAKRHIPEKAYISVCHLNTYSRKLLDEMSKTPQYDVGALVKIPRDFFVQANKWKENSPHKNYQTLRHIWPSWKMNTKEVVISKMPESLVAFLLLDRSEIPAEDIYGIVLDHDPVPSISYAKGCRTYDVMVVGDMSKKFPVLVLEERWLKKDKSTSQKKCK